MALRLDLPGQPTLRAMEEEAEVYKRLLNITYDIDIKKLPYHATTNEKSYCGALRLSGDVVLEMSGTRKHKSPVKLVPVIRPLFDMRT